MRFIPPLSKAEAKAQQDFQILLQRYLQQKGVEFLSSSIKAVLQKNGYSPRLEEHEICRVTLGEFFAILAIINDPDFNQQVLALTRPADEPQAVIQDLAEPAPTLNFTPPEMDDDFL